MVFPIPMWWIEAFPPLVPFVISGPMMLIIITSIIAVTVVFCHSRTEVRATWEVRGLGLP